MEQQVFLLLGTNEGNRLANLKLALAEIGKQVGEIVTKSSIYQTAAWGKTDQPDFYNQVVQVQTALTPHALLASVLSIEKQQGRVRAEKWGSRVIDIDILYIGHAILNEPALIIPHAALATRRFALVPLAEVAPHFVHPVLQESNAVLLSKCEDELKVIRLR